MKILIVTNGGIGDQVHFSSLIKGLKLKYPESLITIFCHPKLQFVYKYDKNVETITSNLEDETFDLGFNFALRNDLTEIFSSVEIKERVGFIEGIKATNETAKELRRIAVAKERTDKSLGEWLCLVAGVDWVKPYFAYKETGAVSFKIILQYGTNIEEKNWSKEYYDKFLSYAVTNSVLITGHTKNAYDIRVLSGKYNIYNLIGDYEGLNEAANYLANSKILITPDTSVAHIGLALGIQTFVLSAGYGRGFAYSDKLDNLHIIEGKTMRDITPEMVVEKLCDSSILNQK